MGKTRKIQDKHATYNISKKLIGLTVGGKIRLAIPQAWTALELPC
jgi:hypothetical protein